MGIKLPAGFNLHLWKKGGKANRNRDSSFAADWKAYAGKGKTEREEFWGGTIYRKVQKGTRDKGQAKNQMKNWGEKPDRKCVREERSVHRRHWKKGAEGKKGMINREIEKGGYKRSVFGSTIERSEVATT